MKIKMKNSNLIKSLFLTSGFMWLSLSSSVSMADTTYLGVNYPLPQVANQESQSQAPNLNQLLSDNIRKQGEAANADGIPEMRRQALIDMGFSVGSSSGLVNRMGEIRKEVNANAAQLDHLFDFTRVTIDNGVLAPVLTEGLSNYAQESDDEVRIADKIYKIESPAKFVSVYPTWRSYLIFSYPTHEIPPAAYLPKNSAEKSLWDRSVKEGWASGVKQANNIFEASYNRLERDYKGMIKYKILLAEGLITPTIIAKQNMGVTGGGNEMSINDQVFRISDHSSLNPNKSDWNVEYPISNNVNGVLK